MYYKFLLFDLDHTLLDFEVAEELALTALLVEEGVEDIESYKAYYVPMNAQMWKALEQKKISKSELINTRFSKLFAHFGQEIDGMYLAERYQHFLSQQGQTFPGARQLLVTLKEKGYRLFGATNGITDIQEGRLAISDIGDLFENVFISEQAGTSKPDKAYYDWIAGEIDDFKATETLMIGDSLTADIQGGINAGLDTVWYNAKKLPDTSSLEPTFVVQTYQELLDILEA